MTIEQLKLLEEKVNKAMELIAKLKERNEELESKGSAESESLEALKEENESLKQDKEIMHLKVSEILTHLEEIEA